MSCGFCGREVNKYMKHFYWENIQVDTCGDKDCFESGRKESIDKLLERSVQGERDKI